MKFLGQRMKKELENLIPKGHIDGKSEEESSESSACGHCGCLQLPLEL